MLFILLGVQKKRYAHALALQLPLPLMYNFKNTVVDICPLQTVLLMNSNILLYSFNVQQPMSMAYLAAFKCRSVLQLSVVIFSGPHGFLFICCLRVGNKSAALRLGVLIM